MFSLSNAIQSKCITTYDSTFLLLSLLLEDYAAGQLMPLFLSITEFCKPFWADKLLSKQSKDDHKLQIISS